MKFTFKHTDGNETTVEAKDEAQGRHKAMVAKWGPPGHDRIGTQHPYSGFGLTLIRQED